MKRIPFKLRRVFEMSVQFLIRPEKSISYCITTIPNKVVFNDICKVLSEILLSNILVISKKGKVLGVGLCPGVDEIEELIEDQVGGFVDNMLNEASAQHPFYKRERQPCNTGLCRGEC